MSTSNKTQKKISDEKISTYQNSLNENIRRKEKNKNSKKIQTNATDN